MTDELQLRIRSPHPRPSALATIPSAELALHQKNSLTIGIGSALLRKAMEGQSSLRLWVFQRNLPAIAFYERHGLVLVEKTDGAGNQEREPDALYKWTRRPNLVTASLSHEKS